jgi:hypothetical protein
MKVATITKIITPYRQIGSNWFIDVNIECNGQESSMMMQFSDELESKAVQVGDQYLI